MPGGSGRGDEVEPSGLANELPGSFQLLSNKVVLGYTNYIGQVRGRTFLVQKVFNSLVGPTSDISKLYVKLACELWALPREPEGWVKVSGNIWVAGALVFFPHAAGASCGTMRESFGGA